MSEIPKIETIDGIGGEYLLWTRDTIERLLARVEELEQQLARPAPADPTNDRWANLTHWIVVAPLRGCECVPRKFDDGTEVLTAERAVKFALNEMAGNVDWEDGGAVKEHLELLVFERGQETTRFVLDIDPRRLPPLQTPDWTPTR